MVEETDVLAIYIDIEKTTQLAGLITEAALDAWVMQFEGVNQAIHAAGFQINAGLVVGEFLQGGGDQNLNGHGGDWAGMEKGQLGRSSWAWPRRI